MKGRGGRRLSDTFKRKKPVENLKKSDRDQGKVRDFLSSKLEDFLEF